MGNSTASPLNKVILIDNLAGEISKCSELGDRKCPVYGQLHRISYQNAEFEIGKSLSTETPH